MKNIKLLAVLIVFLSINIFGQILKPGDGIRINFYNIPEPIKGDYFIQENGKIQLPYLGMINSTDRDFSELHDQIISEYSKIYRDPEISVQSLYRIDILGEVGKPGVYYLSGFETVSDLIALAGGETKDSDIDDMIVIRNDTQLELDIESYLEGENNLADIGIESGDKVYVPRTWWVGARDATVLISGVTVLVAIASLFR
ncbi:MAG: polysaccharide biosynthesis/export family protein [Ignavibacteriales bacterium]|nr:polysaccharide biosynthesis/export family protein [Ignavibacteriota bacterium]MCB9211163.1 polysaccharide biosynthesis/export family protein [Ignavibacteriales bacterium]MCB9247707.1 polysaccharide biosynthesis/export family protein [Ignavibacteriales bacterium]